MCDSAKAALQRGHFGTARAELQRALRLCDEMDPAKAEDNGLQLEPARGVGG